MHILNFFIIPIILVSLFFKIKFSYLISLLCSLAAATFIYAQQANLANILFTIAIFNLTPLLCRIFSFGLGNSRLSLEAKKTKRRAAYEATLKEHSLIRQSNLRLSKEVSRIVELYRMMRDMSAVLGFKEICDIFGKKLIEYFKFKRYRMVLIDEDVGALATKKVFELKYDQPQVHQVDVETDDVEILKQSLRAQKITYIEEKSKVFLPLMTNSKFVGALVVEDLPINALENFSILANQFSLEFKRIRLYQKIQELAITDGLTGLFVRRYFLERLQEEMKRSARHGLKLAFLMLDIDHFKKCNDNFGHLTGDVVLREVARVTKANVREIDLVARYGGEEFSVLLPETDKEGGRNVAERIRASIDGHKFRAYDETIKVEVSIGVAGFPKDSTKAQILIDKSDQALYRAKQEGRNRVCLFKG